MHFCCPAKEFLPGGGAPCNDEEDSEDCSDSETVGSLGELSLVDAPEPDPSPICDSEWDKHLMRLACQFKKARNIQTPPVEHEPVTKKPDVKPDSPKPAVALPAFAS